MKYGSSKDTIRKGIVKGMQSTARKAKGIKPYTKLRIKLKEGTSVQFYFGITKTDLPTEKVKTILKNPKAFITATASSLGYNLKDDVIHFIIRNPNDDVATLVRIVKGESH